MSQSILDSPDLLTLQYIITHVFCPLQLPDGDDHSVHRAHSLARAIASVTRLYSQHVPSADTSQWHRISRMLDNLKVAVQFKSLDQSRTVSQLSSMHVGDVLTFLIQAQNAAVLFRKQKDVTIFESFEVSPKAESVMTTKGKLICSYPGPAIEIPNAVFEDNRFVSELANFLVRMNDDILDAAATSRKAQSTVLEARDTPHPRYITELLTGILRGVGRPASITRITKRIGDDVVWNNSKLPWRRSSLWLLIKVAIQTSLDQCSIYKQFMLHFMCCLAKEEIAADLPNDTLQFMSAKISRRLRKLGSFAPDWLSHTVLQTCTSLRSILEKRWKQTQAVHRVSLPWAPSQLDLARDVELSLSGSGEHLRNSLANHNINSFSTFFSPGHHSRGSLNDFLASGGAFFEEAYSAESHVTLYDVEWAIEQGIDTWVDQVTDGDQACMELEILAEKYSSKALKTYADNPERLSVMLLTTIELWVALDKIAVKETPMLADYSPEVPISLLEDLLLCGAGALLRLRRAHQYLLYRHSRCRSGWSVFSPSITPDSFAVRFYEKSPHLQHLNARIEKAACHDVRAKVAELESMNAHHAELKRKATLLDHDFAVDRHGSEYHARNCEKCSIERKYMNMQITVHEWPLPVEQLYAQAVVFELDCPTSFNMWRSATFHLLVDLCSPSTEQKNPYIQLDEYATLRPYLARHSRSRITLASDTKPFIVTHYRKTPIPTTQERVCVNNGLVFYGFDIHARIAVSEVSVPFNVRRYCTYELQAGPYKNLQTYVDGTCHTSNEVLANLVDCHRDLSTHEYIAFGHLRSGGLLQWLNILRELRGRSLSFCRSEVHFLLAQAVSQVGPLDGTELRWHQELEQPAFGRALLGELESLVRDVEANWLELVTMDSVSFLLRRLLSSSQDQDISMKVLELLRVVRGKVLSWVEELSVKLQKTLGNEELSAFLRDVGAICRSTFDVDPSVIRRHLHSAEDLKVLLSSAILINDHTPSNVSGLPPYSRLLLDRNRRLSLVVESVMSDVIQADPSDEGIDRAILWVWPGYRPGSKWTPLPDPHSRWFSCTTAPTTDQSSQVVHFNLLDGSLLVDGKPLGRLPREILQHPQYNAIFGEQVLDVIPSDLGGMDYSTRGVISGHQVYFSLRSNSDLVIKAKRVGDSHIIELIPQKRLEGDLPAVLIEGHAHWLNLATSVMEIRPLNSLWESSPENWKMDCMPGQYRIQKGNKFLVDIRSQSWKMVSSLLRPLDSPQNLLVSVSPIDSSQPLLSLQLSVSLPRYGLSFYVDEDGDLQSHNMREMIYDENQCIGTLFGLVNRLVLRPKIRGVDASELIPQCILIPDGKISFRKDGHHVRVEVDSPSSALARVTYQSYNINTELGCLTGNVSLTNKLYCAYLHALTSGCGIDTLTGKMGIEEALSLLRSASFSSVMRVGSREAELLGLIAAICPTRTWYPKHLKCMQKVGWLDLPASTQHHELFVVAEGIKEHCERVLLFHESQPDPLFQQFPVRDDHLLERAALRAAYLSPSEFGGRLSNAKPDVPYSSRDLVAFASGEQRAYVAATSVHHRVACTTTRTNVPALVESWKKGVSGNASSSLQYDMSWLAPDLPLIWLQTYQLLRESDDSKWYQLLFSLPAMAYASPHLSNLVPMFVAFARDPRFQSEDPPPYGSYDVTEGYSPSLATLRSYVSDSAHSFEFSPEREVPASTGESLEGLRRRQLKLYRNRLDADTNTTVQHLLDTWPCETPPRCSLNSNLYLVSDFTSNVQRHFSSRYRNFKLKEHLIRVQSILNNVHALASPVSTPRHAFQPSQSVPPSKPWCVTLDQLFTRPAPSLLGHDRLPLYAANDANTSPFASAPLQRLLATVEANVADSNAFQRQYASALRTSAECFGREMSLGAPGTTGLPTIKTLAAHYAQCRDRYIKSLQLVKLHLDPRSQNEEALECSGQWPRITAHALFRSLASNSPISLSEGWKECLTLLSLLALELQRARRLLRLLLNDHPEELRSELQNEGCDGWNARAHPDWLLIQLQGNFLVRRVQAEVANEMISPRSGTNTAMQLNMGEGKSSVIVPIVVAVLADSSQLVRVIVPKALTAQMFHLLVDRLGGLTNRRIYFLPFSRSLEMNHEKVAALQKVMSECMKERGILVVQPEHVLSLKLVSVEKQLLQGEEGKLAEPLLTLQQWLHSNSRDILDEIDEILHVRYQLVYTIGLQQHMEGFPDRWTTTAQVLGLVSKYASRLRQLFPLGVEYESGPPGSFPHLRILHPDAGQKLISWIVENVMEGRLANFNFGQLRSDLRDAIRSFISCKNVPLVEVQLVKDYSQHTPLWGDLLLLRGLLATGIISYALRERRWRVDYGLAPTRTMLAVPYRAKDIPAQRAEFGHPDIAIVLTYLSYYYCGLSEEQLKLSFGILLKQDDPPLDYDLWVRDCPAVPKYLQSLKGVNVKSSEQWNNLFPLFKQNKATVDFYLSTVVFPKEAKEFPSKLSCSSWDLAESKKRLLTGFSGTNDSQHLLPLHITQRDPDHQRGTNAKVLSYLLQPENKYYMCMTHANGERRTTSEFLEILDEQEPKIRVLLDVGAQMLDLKNDELAKAWLEINTNASAAIYFNEDDELTVLTRDGSTRLLISSPFAQQLDQCVVYLDDAHTRGTNIKFPSGFRAAVTLGPKVTKDRLVQGCMRMRKLGHEHSIMFFAPLEIDRRIRSVASKEDVIDTVDILQWTIWETCEDIQHRAPHWAQQGMDHTSRYAAWTNFCENTLSSEELSRKWLQPEAKTLKDLYGPHTTSGSTLVANPEIRQRCIELGVLLLRDVSMDEEQEREVVHEVERERQVKRPPRVPPAVHSIHPDVVAFVKKGIVPNGFRGFRRAFQTLEITSAAAKEPHIWSEYVLVTTDFEKTVVSSSKVDEYLRPVMWVVSGKCAHNEVLVVLSPHEVNQLLPEIRSSNKIHLHLYTPRVIRSMKPCDDLFLYNIPTVPTGWTPPLPLMDQLNVFAGQLYLGDYETYIRLCRFLCVYARDLESEENIEVGYDGFILPHNRPRHLQSVSTFQTSPLDPVRTLMGLRRKGMRFAPTDMGKLLDGRLLSKADFGPSMGATIM